MFIIAVIITTQLYLPMKRKKLSLLLIVLIQVWYVFFCVIRFQEIIDCPIESGGWTRVAPPHFVIPSHFVIPVTLCNPP